MAISLKGKTKLTSIHEKLFIEAGGGQSEKTLSADELTEAMSNTIDRLADQQSPLLLKLYRQCVDNEIIEGDAEIMRMKPHDFAQ